MLRLIIVAIFLVIFLILSLPFLLFEKLAAKHNQEKADYAQLRVVQWAFRVVAYLSGVRLTLIGLENIPADNPVLYVGNHQSIFDIVIAYAHVPYRTGFVSKISNAKLPVVALYMKRLYCLFLDRDNIREGMKTILQAIDHVKNGISIFIYPEGTRNKNEDETVLLPFHNGSFKIAQKGRCPIIPVSINNSAAIFEKHVPFLHRTHVILEFGKPISYEELTPEARKDIGEHFRSILTDMIKKNQALI